MCTVTYLPLGNNDFILTSNRDETPLRKTISPQTYKENNVELIYPKDKLAGGTWIGLSDKKRLVCLLNGGFENHTRNIPYRMSRGIIVKELLTVNEPVSHIENFNFIDIEPFTLILVDWENGLETYELVWDGIKKHFNKLPEEPKIWSSSTLYTDEMKEMREIWFADFLNENKSFYQEKIVEFHQNSTLGTPETSPKMKRTFVETVSITSVKKINSEIDMKYFNALEDAFVAIDEQKQRYNY